MNFQKKANQKVSALYCTQDIVYPLNMWPLGRVLPLLLPLLLLLLLFSSSNIPSFYFPSPFPLPLPPPPPPPAPHFSPLSLFLWLSFCLSVFLSVFLSICLSVCLSFSFLYMSLHKSPDLSVPLCLFLYLPFWPLSPLYVQYVTASFRLNTYPTTFVFFHSEWI